MLDIAAAPLGTAEETDASLRRWYALYTCSRHERRVASRLRDRGVETYVPLTESIRPGRRSHRSRRPTRLVPLFPGYVFVRCSDDERVRAWSVPGAVRYVAAAGRALDIPDREIAAVREMLARKVAFEPHAGLIPGQAVDVVAGPLRGMSGTLVRRGRGWRLVVSVNAIGHAVLCDIDATLVEPTA